MRGFSTFTSNDAPPDAPETPVASGLPGRDTSQTKQASNTSTTMIKDVFKDVFMPPMVAADHDSGQATERPEAVTDDNTFT